MLRLSDGQSIVASEREAVRMGVEPGSINERCSQQRTGHVMPVQFPCRAAPVVHAYTTENVVRDAYFTHRVGCR